MFTFEVDLGEQLLLEQAMERVNTVKKEFRCHPRLVTLPLAPKILHLPVRRVV